MMPRLSTATIRRISRASAFWFLTEESDIDRAIRSDNLTDEALKAKYSQLKTKIQAP